MSPAPPPSPPPPNSENCPAASALPRSAEIGADTLSWFSNSARRAYPRESNAPARISASTTRLDSTDGSTFRQKSANEVKAPSASRASRVLLDDPLRCCAPPTGRSGSRGPAAGAGAKSICDSFTSGGSTCRPMPRQAYR